MKLGKEWGELQRTEKSYGSAQLDFAEAQEALLSRLTGEQKAQLARLVLSAEQMRRQYGEKRYQDGIRDAAEQMQDDLRRWLRHLEE